MMRPCVRETNNKTKQKKNYFITKIGELKQTNHFQKSNTIRIRIPSVSNKKYFKVFFFFSFRWNRQILLPFLS